jgi:2-polyprenyl-6-hydroxyphenyl methylase/3-demethylubiquinone-9 3-methyltransferase
MRNVSAKAIVHEGTNYLYEHARGNPSHAYLLPILRKVLASLGEHQDRAIDVGCGNGFVSDFMAQRGLRVVGVEPSDTGVQIARRHFPSVEYYQGSAYEDLNERFGEFDLTVSLEVVEHLYSPKTFAKTLFSLTKPGGVCVVSTPYHGYLKNLALAVSGLSRESPQSSP